MDYFSFCMDGLCLAGQSAVHLLFAGRLTGRKRRIWHFAVYFFLLCTIELVFRRLIPNDGILPVGAGMLALYGMSRFALGNRRSVSWLAAVLAFYVSQLSFGIVNSVEAAVFPRFIGMPLLYLLLAAALAVFLCCAAAATVPC